MKYIFKTTLLLSTFALVGVGAYMLTNEKMRKKTMKKITKAMDNAEAMMNKKMNN